MRFLLSLPLPLLLILCSFVSYGSHDAPLGADKPQEPWSTHPRLIRSANNISFVSFDSEAVYLDSFNPQEPWTTNGRLIRSANDPPSSGAGSQNATNSTVDYSKLTLEQVNEQLEEETKKAEKEEKEMNATQQKWDAKNKEVLKATRDYDKKKEEWERYSDFYTWNTAAKEAKKTIIKMNVEIPILNATIAKLEDDLEPIVRKVENAQQDVNDLKAVDNAIAKKTSETAELNQRILNQGITVQALDTKRQAAKGEASRLETLVETHTIQYNHQHCDDQTLASSEPCKGTITLLNDYKNQFNVADGNKNTTTKAHKEAADELEKMEKAKKVMASRLRWLNTKKLRLPASLTTAESDLEFHNLTKTSEEKPLLEKKALLQTYEEALDKATAAKNEADLKLASFPSDAKVQAALAVNALLKANQTKSTLENELKKLQTELDKKTNLWRATKDRVAELKKLDKDPKNPSTGGNSLIVILASIGALMLIAIVISAIVFFLKRRKKRAQEKETEKPTESGSQAQTPALESKKGLRGSMKAIMWSKTQDKLEERPKCVVERMPEKFDDSMSRGRKMRELHIEVQRVIKMYIKEGEEPMIFDDGSVRFKMLVGSWYILANGVDMRLEVLIDDIVLCHEDDEMTADDFNEFNGKVVGGPNIRLDLKWCKRYCRNDKYPIFDFGDKSRKKEGRARGGQETRALEYTPSTTSCSLSDDEMSDSEDEYSTMFVSGLVDHDVEEEEWSCCGDEDTVVDEEEEDEEEDNLKSTQEVEQEVEVRPEWWRYIHLIVRRIYELRCQLWRKMKKLDAKRARSGQEEALDDAVEADAVEKTQKTQKTVSRVQRTVSEKASEKENVVTGKEKPDETTVSENIPKIPDAKEDEEVQAVEATAKAWSEKDPTAVRKRKGGEKVKSAKEGGKAEDQNNSKVSKKEAASKKSKKIKSSSKKGKEEDDDEGTSESSDEEWSTETGIRKFLKPIIGGNARIDGVMMDMIIQRLARKVINPKKLLPNISTLNQILELAREAFAAGPGLVEVDFPCTVVGDIHANHTNLMKAFRSYGRRPVWEYRNFVFMGDYVDRGKNSLQVIIFLFLIKLRFPNIVLLRGNHEDPQCNRTYGFHKEIYEFFGKGALFDKNEKYTPAENLIKKINNAFACMPLAARIGGKVFCAHGGIPDLPKGVDLAEAINAIPRFLPDPLKDPLATQLLWNDPCTGLEERFEKNYLRSGVGKLYSAKAVHDFCANHNLDLIVRGHQVPQLGREFFAGDKLVTVFSCATYEKHLANNICNFYDSQHNYACVIDFARDGGYGFREFIDIGNKSEADARYDIEEAYFNDLIKSYHFTKEKNDAAKAKADKAAQEATSKGTKTIREKSKEKTAEKEAAVKKEKRQAEHSMSSAGLQEAANEDSLTLRAPGQ